MSKTRCLLRKCSTSFTGGRRLANDRFMALIGMVMYTSYEPKE